MPIHIRISHHDRLVVAVAHGTITGQELMDAVRESVEQGALHYRKIIDVMGTIDGFGALNSTPGISIEKPCPFCWHHTNTDLPFHLPVTKVFSELRVERTIAI